MSTHPSTKYYVAIAAIRAVEDQLRELMFATTSNWQQNGSMQLTRRFAELQNAGLDAMHQEILRLTELKRVQESEELDLLLALQLNEELNG